MPTYTQSTPTAGYGTLDAGDYKVTVENAEDDMSKAGNDMIKLTLGIHGRNNKLFERLVFTENAYWKIDQVLAALGFDVEDGSDFSVESEALIGKTAWVTVDIGEYNGKPSPEISVWHFDPDMIADFESELAGEQEERAKAAVSAESEPSKF
jgi:hypothetical protein